MKDDEQLKEKLKNLFIEMTFNHNPLVSINDTFLLFIKHINQLFTSSYTAIYFYDYLLEKYIKIESGNSILTTDEEIKINELIKERNTRPKQSLEDKESIYVKNEKNQKAHLIKVASKYKQNTYLLLFLKEKLSATTVHILKQELEKYLNAYKLYIKRLISEKESRFLYNLSTTLNATNEIPLMLTILLESLQNHYTKYCLYLSQDYELDESFSVKPLQIDGSKSNKTSTKAFISGEIQKEFTKESNKLCLYAPLKGNQGIYGVIEIIYSHKSTFFSDEVNFVRNIANTAGTAIENAILYQHAKHLVTDLKMLNEATQQLNSNVKFSELIKIVKDQIRETCNASEIAFILFDENQSDIANAFSFVKGSTNYFYTKEGQVLTEFIFNKMKKTKDPIFSGNMKESIQELSHGSLMSFPMEQSGIVHGIVIVLHKEKRYFTFEKFKLIQSYVQHFTLALMNTILKDELEKAVTTDYLTKLYTRNYLDEMITMHMTLDERGALLLFDIDDFKNINDEYGHHVGDKVIVQVAEIIRNNILQIIDAVPARWGGEELAVYLPHISMSEGYVLADKIREQIERLTHPQVTVSCGISEWTSNHKKEVINVFVEADTALYAAKKIGKNSIMTESI